MTIIGVTHLKGTWDNDWPVVEMHGTTPDGLPAIVRLSGDLYADFLMAYPGLTLPAFIETSTDIEGDRVVAALEEFNA